MQTDRWSATPLRLWLAAGAAVAVAFLSATVLFPRRLYDEFIWQYLWGPVMADAHGVGTSGCAVRHEGLVEFYTSAGDCAAATGIVAHPGYTPISTGVYAVVLLYSIGIVLLSRRLSMGRNPDVFYALIPWVFFGGALRVVEDANATLFADTGEMLLGTPWVGFIISPLIYFLVFGLAATALIGGRSLASRGLVERFEYPLAVAGTALLLGTLSLLAYFVLTTEIVGFHGAILVIVFGGATIITGGVWWLTERYWPTIHAGTGGMGIVVIWGHTVDGVANVMSIDWWWVVGLSSGYTPKHVVNRAIIDLATAIQPAAVSEAIGTAWPFLPLKVGVAVVVVWVFNDEVFEESPSFSMLLLVAILAVGLGPGTRDVLRATLGI